MSQPNQETAAAARPVNKLLELQEHAQPFLILISLLWAFLLPVDGLWISFTVLGPLHYLTQMSWLHDRSYFFRDTRTTAIFIAAAFATLACFFIAGFNYQSAIAFIAVFSLPVFLRTPKLLPAASCFWPSSPTLSIRCRR